MSIPNRAYTSKPQYDVDRVKAAIRGQCSAIVQRVTGISADRLTTRHGPCPKHGGKDKFRVFNDFEQTGGAVCNECGKMADIFALVQTMNNVSFPEALKLVADAAGAEPSPSSSKPNTNKKELNDNPESNLKFSGSLPEGIIEIWIEKKQPIVPESLPTVGAQYAKYRNRHPVIAFPAIGKTGTPVGWAICHATGQKLPRFEKGSKEPVEWVKIKNTAHSKAGWIGPKETPNDRIVWKVEGQSDLLALLSLGLPEGHTAVCNMFGAGEDPASNPWMLDRFKGKTVFVLHDCDKAGQEGATNVKNANGNSRPGWAPAIATVAKEVRNVVLPYEIADSHGKDLRDWILEQKQLGKSNQEIYQELLAMASQSPIVNAQAIAIRSDSQADPEDIDYSLFESEHVDDPHRLAKSNLDRYEESHSGRLVFWMSSWWKYKQGRYQPISNDELLAKINHSIRFDFEKAYRNELEEYFAWQNSEKYCPETDKGPPKIRKVTRALVNNVIGAMEGMCLLPGTVSMPCWLPDRTERNYLSVANGLLDIDAILADRDMSVCLLTHSSSWFCPSRLDYEFDPNAVATRWLDYLNYSMDGDDERIRILQEWAGYLLFPTNYLQRFIVFEGEGGNGKTVCHAAMEAMLGRNNVSHVSIEQFGDRFALASTLGKAANISGDAGEIDRIAEGVLKQFTGGDLMQFDRKNREPISVRPTAKLMAAWNSRPRIKDRSQGFWRRMLLVPFDRKIPAHRRVLGMDNPAWWVDQGEAPGILNWALVGLARLKHQNAFTQSKRCDDAMADYKVESNPAAEFLTDYVEFESGAKLDSKKIYEWYVFWAKSTGHHPLSSTAFGKEVHRQFPLVEKKRDRNPIFKNLENSYFGLRFSVSEILGEKISENQRAY